jgi:plastocyanin
LHKISLNKDKDNMKTSTVFISFTFLTILFLLTINVYAVKHVVLVGNFSFNPASVNATVGDTIRWVWSAGTHTTTSTTVPAGAAAWDAPITTANRSFEYKITIAGNYSYFCKIHGLGMSGTVTAANITPTLAVSPVNQNVSNEAGSTSFSVISNAAWTATSNQVWCTATNGGTGNGTITASFSANPSVIQRVAAITVTVPSLPSQTVTVTQDGAPTLTASAGTTTPTVILGQTVQLDVTVTGGTGTYTYLWTSDPAGYTSAIKSPTDVPGSTTIYTCEVASGDQTAVSSVTINVISLPDTAITLQNDTVPDGQVICFDAIQTIAVAGGSTSFTVDGGGSATMVAGQNIQYLPGTFVSPGGYMHGYITTDGQYCNTPFTPVILPRGDTKEMPQSAVKTGYRIFPNPTAGLFTIELINDLASSPVNVDVFNINGEPVLNEKFDVGSSYEISLNGKAAGIYYLRLISGNRNEIIKIIKQ